MATAVASFRLFLSWTHRDRALKEALLEDLLPALGCLSDVRFAWWDDSLLTPGEQLVAGIADRIDGCDLGVLLLSGRYLGRPFIRRHELPRFAGPHADRAAVPVRLGPLPDESMRPDLGGLQDMVTLTRAGRSFAELSGATRRRFALDCAAGIRRAALGPDGYRSL